MRVVCYAINGSGIGHLQRLTAIARWLRRFAAESATPLEIFFLTSSEASQLLFAENFASFKLPSRQVLANAGIDTEKFIPLAKQWTAQTLKILAPDLLLVDTFPAGYYDELLENLPLCRQTAVIHRPLKFDNLDKTAFYEALSQYETIIVPEDKNTADIEIPSELESRIKIFGAIMSREKEELTGREIVRRRLNIPTGDLVIYLSAGGGGDAQTEQRIIYFYETLAELPKVKLVIGAGALYRGRRIYAPNIVWLANENAFEMMRGFDMAISAAGYNTFHELLFAGIPTIFIPQEKWADDQFRRALRAVQAEAAMMFETLPKPQVLRDFVENRREEKSRFPISQNAQKFVSRNHARNVARFLFDKLSFMIEK